MKQGAYKKILFWHPGLPYLTPRKRRRIARREWRRYTEATAAVWFLSPRVGEFTKALCQRLFRLMIGLDAPDLRPCFWYNPEGGAFEPIQDPKHAAFAWQAPPAPVAWWEGRPYPCPTISVVTFYGHVWGGEFHGLKMSAVLFLPKGESPDNPRHNLNMGRVFAKLVKAGELWCREYGTRRPTFKTGTKVELLPYLNTKDLLGNVTREAEAGVYVVSHMSADGEEVVVEKEGDTRSVRRRRIVWPARHARAL